MPTINLSAQQQSQHVHAASSRPWVLGAGAVVIAMQLAAVGVVVSRQVEQAAAKQATAPLQTSSSVDRHPANMAQ